MYNKMWHQTQEALSSLLDKESETVMESQRNQGFIFQMLATFYIKYVQIFRNLENVYDQTVHPQKRLLIRKILDGVMGRILELKHDMVELELTEFHYFDDILQDLKLAPQQLDIPIPKYFLKEKLEVIKGREKILAQILADTGLDMKYSVKSIPLEEAVKVIQIAERARQGRLRAMFMKQIFLQEYRAKQAKFLSEKVADLEAAALQIQKVWRGFHQHKKTEKLRQEEMIFLGMNPPPLFNEVSATIIQAEKVTSLRNEVQIKHEEKYREALVTIKDDLKLIEGPDIKENLQDQIRHWFIECRNLTGTFPDYPHVEEGGSAIIFSNKTPQQVTEDILASQEEEEKNEKNKKKAKKPKKPKEDQEKKSTREKSKEEDEGWKMSPSVFLPTMEEGNNVYKGWFRRIYVEMLWNGHLVSHGDRADINAWLTKADPGLTLGRLTPTFLRCWGAYYPFSAPVTSHIKGRCWDEQGTVRTQRAKEKWCHEIEALCKGSFLVLLLSEKSLGKHFLLHLIRTEPSETTSPPRSPHSPVCPAAGERSRQSHSFTGVARQLQPSVVWIGDTEKTFYKKVPSAERMMEPKRLKKQLPKILRLLKPGDRILIVGTTQRPFDAELQSFCKVYQKIILVPRPDYASRFVLWKQIIQRNGGIITNALNISCLAKVTDGFTQGHIVQVVKGVLTDRRIHRQNYKPLVAAEFMAALTRMSPVYQEEEESFKDWYAKTPMGKKRALALTGGITEKGKGEKKEKKGKKEKTKK
uniref:IQ motif containing with AAA domain 1 n=1 Tax=Lynx canadensis TaxID=61383 RepID=A0A667IGW6_LYNCA